MILADTSVIIERARKRDAKFCALFDSLPIAVCGPVRAEFLSGARSKLHHDAMVLQLDQLTQIPIPDSDWDLYGEMRAQVFASGFSVSLPDVAIAGTAILNGLALWSRDQAHRLMATVVPALNLYQEP